MKKEQLARRLAKESHISTAAAADQVDRVVNEILKRVRGGQSACLPGLGTFRPDQKTGFQFDLGVAADPVRATPKKEAR